MRRVLVDHARRRASGRREDPGRRLTLSIEPDVEGAREADVLAIDDALVKLGARSERQARVVELRWFGGLTFDEVGAALGVSDRTVKSDWRVARAWLRRELAR